MADLTTKDLERYLDSNNCITLAFCHPAHAPKVARTIARKFPGFVIIWKHNRRANAMCLCACRENKRKIPIDTEIAMVELAEALTKNKQSPAERGFVARAILGERKPIEVKDPIGYVVAA